MDIILSKYRHPERGKGKNYESLDVSQKKGEQSNVHAMQCLLLGELFHFLLKSKIGTVVMLAMKARHNTHDKVVMLCSSLTGGKVLFSPLSSAISRLNSIKTKRQLNSLTPGSGSCE